MDKRVQEKKEKLLAALDKGMVQIHLDARRPGVIVPADHRANVQLVLNLSYRFDPPDLTVSEWGVRETLSFSGQRFNVGVPWSALYAILSDATHEVWMYPDDMPKELFEAAVARQRATPPAEDAAGTPPSPPTDAAAADAPPEPRAILREVVMERPADDDDVETDGQKEPTPPRRGHLRLVK